MKRRMWLINLYMLFLLAVGDNIYLSIKNYQIYLTNQKQLQSQDNNLKDIEKQYNETLKKVEKEFNDTEINKIEEFINNIELNKNEVEAKILIENEKKNSLQEKKEQLNNQYIVLKRKKEEEEIKKNTVLISNISTYNQYPNYPTGCESVSLYLLLKYYNVNTSPEAIINDLEKGSYPYQENGITYGGNPELEFVGNPKSYAGYGTYEQAIINVANKYKSGIQKGTGASLAEVLNLVKQNRPVVVWTSINLALPFISGNWIYKPTGETIYWKAQEHAVLVIGYTPTSIIISDPVGGKIKYQNTQTFEARYNYYGKRNIYY